MRSMQDKCARCGCYVGLGNLPRNFHGSSVCDDCFTILVNQEELYSRDRTQVSEYSLGSQTWCAETTPLSSRSPS